MAKSRICTNCGNDDVNFAINIGLCDACIGEKLEELEAENKTLKASAAEDCFTESGGIICIELQDELKEKQELIDELCSQKPCEKCGYGVTGQCYGCIIKQLQAEIKQLKGV